MKLETRFLILIASVLLGCAAGLLYYNQGDLYFANSFRQDESSSSYNFRSERAAMPEKSLKDEIRQQLAANHTLYEFTAASEQAKAENAELPETPEQAEAPSETSGETDSENMGEVLTKMAETSPKLTESLNALSEIRKASPDQIIPKSPEPDQIAQTDPKALISVNDYSQPTPILDVDPIENQVVFQVQNATDAQETLSKELLVQNRPTAPVQVPAPVQVSAPVQIPTSVPISASVPTSVPIQTSAPTETPELIQTSAVVQTPALPQTLTPIEMFPSAGDDLEQVAINQAVGSLAAPPDRPTERQTPPAVDNSEDLDQNPLAVIMGLNSAENSNESETSDEPETTPANGEEAPAAAPVADPAAAPAEPQAEAQAAPQAADPAAAPAEAQVEPQAEMDSDASKKQTADSPFSHHPTRIKKPDRSQMNSTEKESGAPIQKDEYSLDIYRVNLRKALASFQIETGLKVVASLDVQGTVSCKSKNADPEVLLGSLLADTPFKFVRSGNFVYIALSSQLENLPTPLEKTSTQLFTPEHISLEELELVFRSNLSQFGTCEVTRDSMGQKCLSVTDWVLSLDQLEKIQQIVDVPAPENRIDAFVFQRELDGTFKSLELQEIADSQGLVLQRVSPMESEPREEKKTFFPGNKTAKKEKSSEIQAYTISYRADSFMASIRQQLKTQPAPMPGQTSAPLELDQPMRFDFNLNVQDRQIPYQITVTYRQNSSNVDGINAEVVCEPREDLGPKAKAKDFHYTLAIPSQSRNSLILQMDLGEFPVENAGARKEISYAMRGNRMKKEVIVVLHPFQSVPKIRKNGLSTQAVREIIRQQEVLARKFYGSLDQNEREDSRHCLGIAQRLRLSLGETGVQSSDPGFEQEL